MQKIRKYLFAAPEKNSGQTGKQTEGTSQYLHFVGLNIETILKIYAKQL